MNLLTDTSRIERDPSNDAIRAWFDPAQEPMAKAAFLPRELAREALQEHSRLFKFDKELKDLTFLRDNSGPGSHSVRFVQEFRGVPVDSSEVVVNLSEDGRPQSIYNHYHYDIPARLDPKKIKVKADEATQAVNKLLRPFERKAVGKPKLVIYQIKAVDNHPPKPPGRPDRQRVAFLELAATAVRKGPAGKAETGEHFLAWDFTATTTKPRHSWRILIDAMSGEVLQVIDLFQYASGAGRAYDPNPIVTSGNTGLSSATPVANLNLQTSAVVMDRLNAADAAGNLHLDGAYVQMQEIESPTFAEPVSGLGDFIFGVNDRNFLAGMCHYHLDRMQNYIQVDLGLNNVANFSLPVDPQGFSGADNSRYDPVGKNLAFGEGGIPDAADAHVILHEYGHAIQDNVNPGFDNPQAGTGEGFGDFLAAVYYDDKHANPAATRGIMMSWDANPTDGFWAGRRYDWASLFDSADYTGGGRYQRAEIWCSAMFELYRKLGGDSWYAGVKRGARDLTIRLHMQANFNVPSSGSTATQMGQQVEAADSNLGGWRGLANGLHKKVIYDTFRRRHLGSYPDLGVDVYVDDGRAGGYGSMSGSDLFTETLWQDNYWNTQDIWVRTSAYADAAAQAAGGPGDHVEPPVGSTAYLYTRVKNRGTAAGGSGPVNVRAFSCAPGIGLVWPNDWLEMDASAVTQPANILPGAGSGVIVGPFTWAPDEVGHECVLVVAECANDHAVTQDLAAGANVEHSNLVPFDNNIAQRNLAPTAAKGKMKRGFYVRNPDDKARIIKLRFVSDLPEGWRFTTNLVTPEAIRLAPRERHWVEVVIDQAAGNAVERFDRPFTLTVTGTIDERVIGGMTFYLAPDSAFPRGGRKPGLVPGGHGDHGEHHGTIEDLFCLNIPWHQCVFDGEVDIKIRFRQES